MAKGIFLDFFVSPLGLNCLQVAVDHLIEMETDILDEVKSTPDIERSKFWTKESTSERLQTCQHLKEALALTAAEMESKQIDLMASLGDVYGDFLRKHFRGLGDNWDADELLVEYGSDMRPDQYKALSAFIEFWNRLEHLEVTK